MNHKHFFNRNDCMSSPHLAGITPRKVSPLQAISNDLENALRLIKQLENAVLSEPPIDAAERIRTIIRKRRKRDRLFPSIDFADAPWDILLELTLARLENKKISVSSLTIAAAVPVTTALRHVNVLQRSGHLRLVFDPADQRRKHVYIDDEAFATMLVLLTNP